MVLNSIVPKLWSDRVDTNACNCGRSLLVVCVAVSLLYVVIYSKRLSVITHFVSFLLLNAELHRQAKTRKQLGKTRCGEAHAVDHQHAAKSSKQPLYHLDTIRKSGSVVAACAAYACAGGGISKQAE